MTDSADNDKDNKIYFEKIREELLAVESDLNSVSSDSFASAANRIQSLQEEIRKLKELDTPESTALIVSVLTAQAHVERAHGKLEESAETYEKAIVLLDHCEFDSETLNRRSSNLWICRGLARLSGNSDSEWKAALTDFDKAIEIRSKDYQPASGNGWGLAAAWMNRADALGKLGSEENLNLALESLDEAIEVLAEFDPEANPSFRSRLALAWMNRGNFLARLSLDYPGDRSEESLSAYSNAVDVLKPGEEQGIPESRRMLAVALSNLSRARFQLLQSEGAQRGAVEARECLALIGGEETTDPELAGLGIVTRITLCSILDSDATVEDRYSEITDMVEDGLRIIQGTGREVVEALSDPLGQLFLFGAETYRRHFPNHLEEYLLEFLAPDPDKNPLVCSASCHEAAVQTLWRGVSELQQKGFGTVEGETFSERSDRISQWQECRERLAEIRAQYFETE